MCGPAFAPVRWSPRQDLPRRRQETRGLITVNIEIVTPASSQAGSGNTVTARRYARILASLGHRATLVNRYNDARCDLLIALHAARSALSVLRFRRRYPESPL